MDAKRNIRVAPLALRALLVTGSALRPARLARVRNRAAVILLRLALVAPRVTSTLANRASLSARLRPSLAAVLALALRDRAVLRIAVDARARVTVGSIAVRSDIPARPRPSLAESSPSGMLLRSTAISVMP